MRTAFRKAGGGWGERQRLGIKSPPPPPPPQRPSPSGERFCRPGSSFAGELGNSSGWLLEEQERFGCVGLEEKFSYTEGLHSDT